MIPQRKQRTTVALPDKKDHPFSLVSLERSGKVNCTSLTPGLFEFDDGKRDEGRFAPPDSVLLEAHHATGIHHHQHRTAQQHGDRQAFGQLQLGRVAAHA